jgi:hypothetical protein
MMFSESREVRPRALELCACCLVSDQCREYGKRERYGVWGGHAKTHPSKS